MQELAARTLMYVTCHTALKRKDTSADSESLLHRTARDFLPKTRHGDGTRKADKDKGGNKMIALSNHVLDRC